MKNNVGYAVVLEEVPDEPCFTWDKPHPQEKRKVSVMVFAVYPFKKDAISDAKFRGGSKVVKVKIVKEKK